ncbi:MAG: hpnC [Frankiales bacterium]|nr:hpnC [Frankiales bacterium]
MQTAACPSGHPDRVPSLSPSAGPTVPSPADLHGSPGGGSPALREKERAENFPVALRLLPRDLRDGLRAVYDVVRTIDDLGDDPHVAPDARLTGLTAFAEDLRRVWSTGTPQAPVLRRLVPAVRRHHLPHDCFDRLIRANIIDQQVSRYETFSDLLDYCALSAAPVGELVLYLLDRATPERILLSDRVCAALQIAEHLQDVAEDRARGRIYLPREDLSAHGVREEDLRARTASPALRRLIAAEAARVADLLGSGVALVAGLSGWGRIAVAGYVAGGRAALDGLRRADGDVLPGSPGVRRRDVLRHVGAVLISSRGTGRW